MANPIAGQRHNRRRILPVLQNNSILVALLDVNLFIVNYRNIAPLFPNKQPPLKGRLVAWGVNGQRHQGRFTICRNLIFLGHNNNKSIRVAACYLRQVKRRPIQEHLPVKYWCFKIFRNINICTINF